RFTLVVCWRSTVTVPVVDDPNRLSRFFADRPQAVRHLGVEGDRITWAELEFLEADPDAKPPADHIGVFFAAVANQRILVTRFGSHFVDDDEEFDLGIRPGSQPFPSDPF